MSAMVLRCNAFSLLLAQPRGCYRIEQLSKLNVKGTRRPQTFLEKLVTTAYEKTRLNYTFKIVN